MELKENQVFIFGSNGSGFHGAGGAGLACRGESANTWRLDQWFLKAMKSPVGSPDRIGKWAIFGVARGFQQGREGASYAIQTVTKPGAKRSISLQEIAKQITDLYLFAEKHPELTFLISPIGEGYAGYTHEEMQDVWDKADQTLGKRTNFRFLNPKENLT
jgi:hypothetical protein